MKVPRKKPTKAIEHAVREECGNACANPTCREWSTAAHELHHIDGDRSRSVVSNLLLICGSCHNKTEAGIISAADIITWKRMAQGGWLPPQKGQAPSGKTMVGRDNYGIVAENIKFTGQVPKGPIRVDGSLATSADHYGYVEYLIKRLSKYRSWRPRGGGPPDNPGVVRKIFERDFGCLPKDLKLEKFESAEVYLVQKIENTALGRMKRAPFSSFDAWKAKGT